MDLAPLEARTGFYDTVEIVNNATHWQARLIDVNQDVVACAEGWSMVNALATLQAKLNMMQERRTA